jgi:hypothetical protein
VLAPRAASLLVFTRGHRFLHALRPLKLGDDSWPQASTALTRGTRCARDLAAAACATPNLNRSCRRPLGFPQRPCRNRLALRCGCSPSYSPGWLRAEPTAAPSEDDSSEPPWWGRSRAPSCPYSSGASGSFTRSHLAGSDLDDRTASARDQSSRLCSREPRASFMPDEQPGPPS